MLTCLTDSKKIRLLSCRLTTLPQIVSQRSLLRQNVQESNHSTHFLLVHSLSKAELLLFFFPLFFFKFRQKIDYLRGRRLRPVNAVTKEETVPGGIIFGLHWVFKFPVLALCSLTFCTSPLIFSICSSTVLLQLSPTTWRLIALQLYPLQLSFILCFCRRGRFFPFVRKSIVWCSLTTT